MATSSPASSLLFLLPSSSSSSSSKTLIPNPALQPLSRGSSLSFSASSHSLLLASKFRPLSLFCSARSFGPALVRHVAAAPSDLEDEEELLSGGEEEEEEEEEEVPRFSPELKVFVGNLPFSVDSAELAELFSRVGTVEMAEVIYDKLTGKSRGFGFVTMSDVQEVDAAARTFNGFELHGRTLRVNYGPPPPRDGPPARRFRNEGNFDSFRSGDNFDSFRSGDNFDSFRSGGNFNSANRIHVANLSWGVDDLALHTFFSKKGRVLDAKVIFDRESGRSRGFGFVTYSSAEEVDLAISSLNGAELEGRAIRVTVAEARSRSRF